MISHGGKDFIAHELFGIWVTCILLEMQWPCSIMSMPGPTVTGGRNINKIIHWLPLKGLPLGTPSSGLSAMAFRSQSFSLCLSSPLLGFLPKQASRLPLCGSTTPLTSPCLYPLTDPVRSERTRKYLSQWSPERLMEVSGWSQRDHMLISEDGVPWLTKSKPLQGHTSGSAPWEGAPGRQVVRRVSTLSALLFFPFLKICPH